MIAIEEMAGIHERPEIKFGLAVKLSSDTIGDTTRLRDRLAHAYNALADLGDLARVGDRIVQDQNLSSTIEAKVIDASDGPPKKS